MEFQGRIEPRGDLGREVIRSAESWQFFAFVFAALLTVLYGVVDELPEGWKAARIALKLLGAFVLWYATLHSPRGRNFLARALVQFKRERHG